MISCPDVSMHVRMMEGGRKIHTLVLSLAGYMKCVGNSSLNDL